MSAITWIWSALRVRICTKPWIWESIYACTYAQLTPGRVLLCFIISSMLLYFWMRFTALFGPIPNGRTQHTVSWTEMNMQTAIFSCDSSQTSLTTTVILRHVYVCMYARIYMLGRHVYIRGAFRGGAQGGICPPCYILAPPWKTRSLRRFYIQLGLPPLISWNLNLAPPWRNF